jgi:hypothetical protein
MFSRMSDDRCGEVGGRGRCQFHAGHRGLHTLVWPSGDRMVLRTWYVGAEDENDDALDYPYPAPVLALPWARDCPKVELPATPMAARDPIIAAQDAWRAAEKAYSDEASKYVAAWWVEGEPPPTMPKPVTREALDRLVQLRAAADSARTAYHDVLGA